MAFSAQGADVRLFAHYPMGDTLSILFTQGFGKREVGGLVAVWPEIIGSVIKLGGNSPGWNEVLNFYFTGRLWLQAFKFFVIENHERSRLDFKTLLNLNIIYFLAALGIDHVLLNPRL